MGRRSRSASYDSRSRSRSLTPEGYRLHVGDLTPSVEEKDIEKAFKKFGPLYEVWFARNPPCFAFVVFKNKSDAENALEAMHGKSLCGAKVTVSWARPRNRGGRRPPPPRQSGSSRQFNSDLRCYSCGERGHFSRDCSDVHRNRRDRGSRSPSPYAARGRRRRSSRSYSKSPKQRRYRSRSASPRRDRSRSPSRGEPKRRVGANDSGRKGRRRSRSISPQNGHKNARSRSPSPAGVRNGMKEQSRSFARSRSGSKQSKASN